MKMVCLIVIGLIKYVSFIWIHIAVYTVIQPKGIVSLKMTDTNKRNKNLPAAFGGLQDFLQVLN